MPDALIFLINCEFILNYGLFFYYTPLIISLGSWCGPSINLRERQLRRFSFPLDWMISSSISDVTRLLSNRFIGFMELGHMRKVEGTSALLEDGIATPF
ncbi:DUF1796 family putative cysteine peptidase [Paenibacillus lautus]|uniref:DUF1796 family putative cysteine peptidase n=1 Tax=Paenibacillus lautus TaxID=1401 RepID=UPI003D2E2D59